MTTPTTPSSSSTPSSSDGDNNGNRGQSNGGKKQLPDMQLIIQQALTALQTGWISSLIMHSHAPSITSSNLIVHPLITQIYHTFHHTTIRID